jgi:hypothetical protein
VRASIVRLFFFRAICGVTARVRSVSPKAHVSLPLSPPTVTRRGARPAIGLVAASRSPV